MKLYEHSPNKSSPLENGLQFRVGIGAKTDCRAGGDHSVLSAVKRLCKEEQLIPENTVFVSGIGCSSRFPPTDAHCGSCDPSSGAVRVCFSRSTSRSPSTRLSRHRRGRRIAKLGSDRCCPSRPLSRPADLTAHCRPQVLLLSGWQKVWWTIAKPSFLRIIAVNLNNC